MYNCTTISRLQFIGLVEYGKVISMSEKKREEHVRDEEQILCQTFRLT